MISFVNFIDKLKDILSNELGNKKIFDKDVATALELNYNNFGKAKVYTEIMSFLAKRNILLICSFSINYLRVLYKQYQII